MSLVQHLKPYWFAWKFEPKERAKLVLGCLIFPKSTYQWLSYLASNDRLKSLSWAYPRVVTRIYRPYALRTLNCRERVAHMIEHHDILQQIGWAHLTHAAYESPLKIVSWTTLDANTLALQLVSFRDGHREGESSLQLLWNGSPLFSLTFLLRKHAGVHQVLVTRFQGSKSEYACDWIRLATKALNGLRPADLLVHVAQHFGKILGCEEIFFVSNHHRVALNPMRRLRIKIDLDRIWLQRGAMSTSEGLFVLPTEVAVRTDFSDVAANKRAQAKRKADLLRDVLLAFEEKVHQLRAGALA